MKITEYKADIKASVSPSKIIELYILAKISEFYARTTEQHQNRGQLSSTINN